MPEIVGYGFDGAIYCPGCVPDASQTGCRCHEVDENGACMNNCHGYGPNPVFSTDEGWEEDVCDTCGGTLA